MGIESVLTSEIKDSLEITKFIFHIIIQDEEKPIYLDEVKLDASQVSFFRERIIEGYAGTQYVFTDKENSTLLERCQQLFEPESTMDFNATSRKITGDFFKLHSNATSDGVLVVAIVNVVSGGQKVGLVALIKMDHQRVLRYNLETDGETKRAIIEEIKNSFVENKDAIQKMALIDASDHFAWDVLGRERKKEGIADYFKAFLGVAEREHASTLTVKAVTEARKWASMNPTHLPSGQNASSVKVRAIAYMETHTRFDVDDFIEMVIFDEDVDRKKAAAASIREHFEVAGIAGQHFAPKPNSIPKRARVNRYQTSEGVKIEFDGEPKVRGVEIPNQPDRNGKFVIKIETDGYSLLQ